MKPIVVIKTIKAPIDIVFATVSDIRQFSKALPHVSDFEILSDIQMGDGTRFRETRIMNGKENTGEFEVTEYISNEKVRIVTDSHGTVWDTLFELTHQQNETLLTLTMEAKAYQLIPKIINTFIRKMVLKAVEQDMDFVKKFCETETV